MYLSCNRCCSPGLAILLVAELAVIVVSIFVLVTMGSGEGITIRTDIAALICTSGHAKRGNSSKA